MSTIAIIEQSLVDTLNTLNIGKYVTVESYHAELTDVVADIQSGEATLPVVYILYTGSTSFLYWPGKRYRETIDFSIIIAASDLRSSEQQAGVYELVEVVKADVQTITRLEGVSSTLLVTSVNAELINNFVAIYSVRCQTTLDKN